LTLVACAAEQVGIAQRCHDAAVAWAKERVQFDRPIGQFQAIKHLLVDLLMDVELSRSALDVAIDAAQKYLDGPSRESADSLRVAARFAASRAGDAATHVADESLHVHGGIGFTWEHDAHLYYRRARSLEIIHGDPASHRLDMARALLGVTDV
jgi:alkylation response protein AidB-like acyl-CoA dehydrogenase